MVEDKFDRANKENGQAWNQNEAFWDEWVVWGLTLWKSSFGLRRRGRSIFKEAGASLRLSEAMGCMPEWSYNPSLFIDYKRV